MLARDSTSQKQSRYKDTVVQSSPSHSKDEVRRTEEIPKEDSQTSGRDKLAEDTADKHTDSNQPSASKK
jgi:hypothetical protein